LKPEASNLHNGKILEVLLLRLGEVKFKAINWRKAQWKNFRKQVKLSLLENNDCISRKQKEIN
jgi:hypothetical protein